MFNKTKSFATLTLLSTALVFFASSSAQATTASYTSSATVSPATPSQYSGSAGGDGWGLAFYNGNVYNVFHHSLTLQVACHNQTTAQTCHGFTSPKTVYDSSPNGLFRNYAFATSSQPTIWIDQATGKLYVYATAIHGTGIRLGTAGVVCVDTTSNSSNPFCGFSPLSALLDSALQQAVSNISDGVIVGANFYAVNFYSTSADAQAGSNTTTNTMMCFSLTTFSACPGQPYAINFGTDSITVPASPAPTIAASGSEIIIPFFTSTAISTNGNRITCFDTSSLGACTGTWPIDDPAGLASSSYNMGPLTAVSCDPSDPAAQNCTAVGFDQATNLPTYSVEVAGQWQKPVDFPTSDFAISNTTLNGISCIDALDCVAVGSDGNNQPITITETAGSWGAPEEVSISIGALNGVSCTDITNCVAVGSDYSSGQALAVVGSWSSWGQAYDVGGISSVLSGISCPDQNNCVAVGTDNSTYTPMGIAYSYGVWEQPTDVSTSYGGLSAISCTDVSDCVAVGQDQANYVGWYIVYNSGWDTPVDVSGATASFSGVSCTDASQLDCVLVGFDENFGAPLYAVSSNFVMGVATDAGPSGTLSGVSCGSTSVCSVVGSGVINYATAPMTGSIDALGNPTLNMFSPNYGDPSISNAGGALPTIDPTTNVPNGFCMRNNSFSCFDLSGTAVSSTADSNLSQLLAASANTIAGWEGPATQFGAKIYFANENGADCYDFAAAAECLGYPLVFPTLTHGYSLTVDPNRPGCLWENADAGDGQIQNFDIYTGSTCGLEGNRFSITQFTQPPTICNPQVYSTLVVQSPDSSSYSGGTVQFEDSSGNLLGSAIPIGSDGSVDLSSISSILAAQSTLPQFLVRLPGAPLTPVTVEMNWIATNDPSCYLPPSSSAAPRVSGTPVYGQTVSSNNGSWTMTDGTYSYQWYSCAGLSCTAVGTNASTYELQASDIGNTVYSVVTATGLDGSTLSQDSSNVIGPVTGLPTRLQLAQSSTNLTANGNFVTDEAITLTATVSVGSSVTSVMVPDSSGTVEFDYTDSHGLSTIVSCGSVATVNGIATCTYTPTGPATTHGTLRFSAIFVPVANGAYGGSNDQKSAVTVVGIPQAPVIITNTTFTSPLGTPIALTASGGSGVINYSFALSPECLVESGNLLSRNHTGTCTITAINPANGDYAMGVSAPVTFTFTTPTNPPVTPHSASAPPLHIQFRFDSTVLSASAKKYLDGYAKRLIALHVRSITVRGYASFVGLKSWNMILSKWRAIAVCTYLKNALRKLGHSNIRVIAVTGGIRTTSTPWGLNQVVLT